MNIKIGSAPDSWGVWFSDDPKQIPWDRFLDEIADAGFTWTELGPYGYLPTELRLLEEQLWRRNLKVTGGFVMQPLEDPAAWPTIEREVLSAGELLAGLDAECLILIDDLYSDPFTGQTTASRRLDYEGWCQLIDTVHRVSRLASEKCGLRMVFHPHAETHVEYEDQIERVLAESDASLVHLCLDVGHHAYRGGDPIAHGADVLDGRKVEVAAIAERLDSLEQLLAKLDVTRAWPRLEPRCPLPGATPGQVVLFRGSQGDHQGTGIPVGTQAQVDRCTLFVHDAHPA